MLRNGAMVPRAADTALARRITVAELDGAVRRQEIYPEFQPKIALADGHVAGVEALARWRLADGDVTPDVFIPLAERSGLIVPLTFCVLRQGLAACRRWREEHPQCSVAVNISPLVLADPGLPEEIERLLRENALGPGALIAEVTESTVIGQPLVAAEVLTRLRIKGVRLSIDDFGTGHSSLMTLHRLPYSELKIDRSFVTNCDSDADALKIVRATISMARELGLTVVAEGIETEPVEALVREAGCHIGQGWRFGRSMTEAALAVWLGERSRVPVNPVPA
jgi:EAL domain-containing protein (putative c-di-GMP-specific phosphodiesterase class I)